MTKLLEQIFTIIFLPGYEEAGFRFLLTSISRVDCTKDDNNRYRYKVRQNDLKLLDQAGIIYNAVNGHDKKEA